MSTDNRNRNDFEHDDFFISSAGKFRYPAIYQVGQVFALRLLTAVADFCYYQVVKVNGQLV